MAIAPVNKFLSVAVPVTPGAQKIYEVPTGTSAILLYAQVSNVGIGQSYPTVTLIHRRETRSTGITRDIRIIKNIEVPPNDAAILIDGRLVLEKTATTLDRLFIEGVQSGINTITDVKYSPYSGIATVTTMNPHGFNINEDISMVGIAFTCSSNAGITTTIFPDPSQSNTVESIVDVVGTSRTFTSVIGGTGALFVDHFYNPSPHTFVKAVNNSTITGGDHEHVFKGAGLSTSVGALVLGGDYAHTFKRAAPSCIQIQSGGSGTLTPIGADYTPSNGNLELTFASNPGLANGSQISIATTSLTFTCAMDGHATEHSYPRVGDPINGLTNVAISSAAGTAFNVNVGASATTRHTVSDATYNAGTGEMVLTIPAGYNINRAMQSKTAEGGTGPTTYNPATGVLNIKLTSHGLSIGDKIRFDDEALTFTCAKDNNVGQHKYPRATDPESNKWLYITEVPDLNHFKLQISPAGATGQHAHTFVSCASNGMKVGADSCRIGDNSILFSCSMDNTGNYSHIYNGGTATNAVNVTSGGQNGQQKSPNGATYNPITGVLSLSFASAHSMSTGDTITLDNNSISFTCDKDNHATTHTYPRATDPASGATLAITKTSNTAFTVNVGTSPMSVHSYPRARDPYYQTSIGIGATTTTTVSVFVGKSPIKYFNPSSAFYNADTGDMNLTLGTNYALTGQTLKTPTAASYNPTTGLMDFTVNSHGLTLGDKIRIQDRSLIFTCDKDLRQTEHPYPRSSDPYSGKWLTVTPLTANTFRVYVGTSSNTSTHYFKSALANCIRVQGDSIKLANDGFVFTCAMDGNATEHAYPRFSDPYHNIAVGIGTTTSDSVTVHVGKSPSGGMVGPLQMEFIGSILENNTT